MNAEDRPADPFPSGAAEDGQLDTQGLGTVAWMTDVGLVRGRNEDRLLVKPVWGGAWLLLLVADGAGGHDSGDKAAEQVVETFNAELPLEGDPPPGDPTGWLQRVIHLAHANVRALAEGQARPPASTAVGVLVERASLCGWRFHVGDSRLYVRPPGGMVAQWTRDHNITNGLIDRGLPVAQALRIADGGRLTQVMGGVSDPEAEVLGPLKFDPGTVLLLCSDGVYGHNGDREVLVPAMRPDGGTVVERAAALKAAVLEGDAPDNLTAVIWQVPDDAEASRERETVTNSMRSVTAEDVEKALARKVRAELGLGPGPDDAPPSPPTPPAPPPRAKGGLIWPLLLAGVVVVVFLLARRGEAPPAPPPPPAPTAEEPAELPDEGLRREPMEPAPETLAALVGGFDAAWWGALPAEQRQESLQLLTALLAAEDAAPQTLISPVEPGVAYTMDGWPASGGRNDELAAAGWAARGRLMSRHPELLAQPGVQGALRGAACARVTASWPRGDSMDPGDAGQLASWLAACLEAPGASLEVHLGGWPARGWRLDELNQAKFLASRGDPAALLRTPEAESPRILELSLLAAALRQPSLSGIEVEVEVVQPDGDFQASNLLDEKEVQASSRAHEIVGMLRSAASDNPVRIHGSGRVASDLSAVFGASSPTAEQQRALDDIDRRVDVRFRRPKPPAEEEDELPGAAAMEPGGDPPGPVEPAPEPGGTGTP